MVLSWINQIIAFAAVKITEFISALGYFGVFILMVFESMVIPIPSELVLPFAGFLASNGTFNLVIVILVSAIASLTGSLISYYMGLRGGNKLIAKYGRYFFVDLADLAKTEKWFAEKGEKTVLISRFLPVVRHLISIPAGIAKMDLKKFCIYTLLGASLWDSFLILLGYYLGQKWEEVKHYSEYFSLPSIIILVCLGSYYLYHHIKNKRQNQQLEQQFQK
ncbi:DedA family protein [Candidatus Woesearchaeota archaeon]|nr:DedA family protein [Candidatus Woesearchaeota archaeon]